MISLVSSELTTLNFQYSTELSGRESVAGHIKAFREGYLRLGVTPEPK